MRCEDETSPGHDGGEGPPHDAFGADVHAGAGLVEEEHGGVTHKRDGEGEFAFVAARELGRHAVGERLETDGAKAFGDVLRHVVDAADAGVEGQVLVDGHLVAGVDLRAHAEGVSGEGAAFADGDVFDEDVPTPEGGPDVAPDHADGGGFAGAVGAQEGEDLAAFHAECDVLDGYVASEGSGKVEGAQTVICGCRDALYLLGDFVVDWGFFLGVLRSVGFTAEAIQE